MNKLFTLLTVLSISLISCDKEESINIEQELATIEAESVAIGGATVVLNFAHLDLSSSKGTTSVAIQIKNHAAAKVITSTSPQGDVVTVYEALIVEDNTSEHPTILGSFVYQLIDFEDTTATVDLIAATATYNDADGNVTGAEHIEPTDSFEFIN